VRSRIPACICIALLLAMPVRLAAQESLTAARQLYGSAEYDQALAMLATLLAANPSPQERQSLELYRILCLFAVDKVADANTALEALILRDPLYRPSMDVVPRRLRATFTDTRHRLLPAIIQEKYVLAKGAFDGGHYEDAIEGFAQTLRALSDPDIAQDAERSPLSDLRLLATSFHELAVKALTPPPVAPAAAAAPVATLPPSRFRVYQAGDSGVTMPVVIRQALPTFPVAALSQRSGVVEVLIDEAGLVQSAVMVTSLNPKYNALVLAAAKSWRYQPATVDGVPVKFKKRIQLTLAAGR